MTGLRSLPLGALAGVLLTCAATAQTVKPLVRPQVRIVAPIDATQLVALRGSVNPHANAENDRGPVSADFALPDLTLVLSRSPEMQAAFDAYVAGEYDPDSANYHQWLTPAEIGERFGPAEADVVTLSNWLASQGFTVKSVAPDRMTIRFAGTASTAEGAFHTEIHNLSVKGVSHYANMTAPQIPAALAPIVVGIKMLHNFLPHPLVKFGGEVEFNHQAGQWQRMANLPAASSSDSSSSGLYAAGATPAASSRLRPQFGIDVSGQSSYLEEDVTPWDFATIYNVIPAWNAGYNGQGQTIAVAGTSLIAQSSVNTTAGVSQPGSDVATFRSTFGIAPLPSFEQIDTGYGSPATECTSTSPYASCGIGDLEENSLDVEWSGAVAPGASIVLVVTGQNAQGTVDTVYDSAQYVVENVNTLNARILNLSYGLCELGEGTAENVAFYDLWQSAAAEGISVFVASGDSGAPSCDQDGDSIGWPYSAQYGLTVSGLASTPYNVAVGGTDFSWCQPTINASGATVGCPTAMNTQGSPAYWASSDQSSTSAEPYESALGYVPEIPWNDTCTNPIIAKLLESLASYLDYPVPSNAEGACNFIQNNWSSVYDTDGIMLAPFIDTVGGSGGASSCVVNSTNSGSNSTGICSTGATSTGAANGSIPLYNDGWVKPGWQSGVAGIPADGVRDLPDVSFFAGNGTLDSAYLICVSAAGSCTYSAGSENMAEEAGGTSFASPAMAGVMALIDQKAGSAQGLPTPELYRLASQQNYGNCSAESVKNSSSCYFQSIDEGTNAMPCDLGASIGGVNPDGYLTQSYQGVVSPNCTALNSGDTVGTLVNPAVAGSGNPNGEAYNAQPGYNLATGLGSLNVWNVVNAWTSDAGSVQPTLNVSLNPSNGQVTGSLTITVTVTGASGTPTGNVVVSGGGYNSTQPLTGGSATIVIPPSSLAVGNDTLTVTYSSDETYASASTTESVTVAAITPTILVSAPATDNVQNPVAVTVTVSGPAGAAIVPAGTVSVNNSAPVTLSSAGTATVTIPANTLPAGSDTITANYTSTTETYLSGSATAQIVMVDTPPLTPTITVTPSPTNISSGQSDAVTVTITGSGAPPTGSLTLSAGSTYSSTTVLVGGIATFTIPANTFAAGTAVLLASYSGDSVYAYGSANATLTITGSTYTLAAGAVSPASVAPGANATVIISGNPSSTGYTGEVSFSGAACVLTSGPSNASSPPTCSMTGSITYANGAPKGTATATVYSTAASSSALALPPTGKGWPGAAALAVIAFLWIPSRRRSWRSMMSVIAVMAAIGFISGCASGVKPGGGGGTSSTPGTTAGSYVFTVTGQGNDPAATTATTTFTVTVD